MVRGPDAPWERQARSELELPERLPRWYTTDAAVHEALENPPGGARALPIGERVSGSVGAAEAYREDTTCVLAALGGLTRLERALVEGYARMRYARTGGYRELCRVSAAADGPSRRERVTLLHRHARAKVHARLVSLGIVAP